ncbi:hypothetical protein KFE25_002770 [Diacronema lutheri]|uniref:AAA ATPase AAA+ lid domain-containing protein n=1 Tax=Diacronema lutheri TaxID=2081491 RepID=A0A8J5XJ16_DIALT|nr:hypothetical protein KFE25_002770 [Diacronema lutheri]
MRAVFTKKGRVGDSFHRDLIDAPLRDAEARLEIIIAHVRRTPLLPDVQLDEVVAWTEGFSSDALMDACAIAGELALSDCMLTVKGVGTKPHAAQAFAISRRNFEAAVVLAASAHQRTAHRKVVKHLVRV